MRSAASEKVTQLKALTSSPYTPEAPRRSLLVDLVMRASLRRGSALVTPHLHGGSSAEKTRYEYETAGAFWVGLGLTVEQLAGLTVLDVGCGWGGKAIYCAERGGAESITGFDLPGVFDPAAAESVARERGLGSCHFTTGYAERIPFGDESFDVVLMDDVMEHVTDPELTIRECERVLRPGGLLVAKFPSIRMLHGHHLDRALTYPGLHYLAPFKTWAAGLNDLLLRSGGTIRFEPFDEVAPTRFHRGLTRNLNGLTLDAFRQIVTSSGLRTRQLELLPVVYPRDGWSRRTRALVYRALWRLPLLRERIGNRIAFIGAKAAPG